MNQLVFCGLLLLGVGASAQLCTGSTGGFPKPVCRDTLCTSAIIAHIEHEFHAAFKYLYMGALFGQYSVERPGMTKFFLESATEERSHAIQMLDYLNMRGIKYDRSYSSQDITLWQLNNRTINEADLRTLTIEKALKEALKMEIGVTEKIDEVVSRCANDYHAADVFTNPILEEQHTGMRKLQGALQTISDLTKGPGGVSGDYFAEYIFDQKMLKGEI